MNYKKLFLIHQWEIIPLFRFSSTFYINIFTRVKKFSGNKIHLFSLWIIWCFIIFCSIYCCVCFILKTVSLSLYKQLGLMISIRIYCRYYIVNVTSEWTSTLFPVLYWNKMDYTSDLSGTHYSFHTMSKVKKKLHFQDKVWNFIGQTHQLKIV